MLQDRSARVQSNIAGQETFPALISPAPDKPAPYRICAITGASVFILSLFKGKGKEAAEKKRKQTINLCKAKTVQKVSYGTAGVVATYDQN